MRQNSRSSCIPDGFILERPSSWQSQTLLRRREGRGGGRGGGDGSLIPYREFPRPLIPDRELKLFTVRGRGGGGRREETDLSFPMENLLFSIEDVLFPVFWEARIQHWKKTKQLASTLTGVHDGILRPKKRQLAFTLTYVHIGALRSLIPYRGPHAPYRRSPIPYTLEGFISTLKKPTGLYLDRRPHCPTYSVPLGPNFRRLTQELFGHRAKLPSAASICHVFI